jgi:hypothetical protein
MLQSVQMSAEDKDLHLVLRSLKDDLSKFISDSVIQSVARNDERLAEIVEKAMSLRNLTETTCKKINPDWKD